MTQEQKIKEFVDKYKPSEISQEVQHLCGFDITEEMCEGFNDDFTQDLKSLVNSAIEDECIKPLEKLDKKYACSCYAIAIKTIRDKI